MRPTHGPFSLAPLLVLLFLVDHDHRSASATSDLIAPIKRVQLSRGISHRMNFCERQAQVDNRTLTLPKALAGLDISVHLMLWSPLHVRTRTDGELDYDNPGILVNIMDHIATRGDFRWRDSFGVGLTPEHDTNNTTFEEILDWALDAFDLSLGEWRNSVSRKAKGIIFPLGIADASLIMVQKAKSTAFDPWSFLSTFSWWVWLGIIATYICSAFIYQFIHFYGEGEYVDRGAQPRMSDSMYEMGMAFNQQSVFTPKSYAGRILVFAINFFSMVMIASYTANLVTHMVLGQTAQYDAYSFNEAERKNIPICVWKGTSLHGHLTTKYPKANLVEAASKMLEYEYLDDGKCDIVSDTVQSFRSKVRDAKRNRDCKLAVVGDPDVIQKSGIAVKGDGARCSSLLRDVLDYHLSDMNVEQVIKREWDKHQDLISSNFCPSADTAENVTKLGFKDLGGVFIVYAMLVVIALITCQYEHVKKKKMTLNRGGATGCEPKADIQDNTSRQEREHHYAHQLTPESTGDQFGSKEDMKDLFRQFKSEITDEFTRISSVAPPSCRKRHRTKSWEDSGWI